MAGLRGTGWPSLQLGVTIPSSFFGQGLRATSSDLSPLEGTRDLSCPFRPASAPSSLCAVSGVRSWGRIHAMVVASTEKQPGGASRLLFVLSSSPSTTAIRNNFLLCPRHLRRAAGPAAALSFSRSSFFHHRGPYFSRKEGEESKCGEVLPQTEHLPCPRHCIMCIHHCI